MSSRNLWIALVVSLALNVFGAGAVVGARLVGAHFSVPERVSPAAQVPARPRNPVMAAVRTLSPDQQAAWREQMPDFTATYGPKVREARRLTRETMQGFGAEPFDKAAALAALQQARGLEHESRLEMDRRLVAFAATLPPADRAKFGEALARPPVRRAPQP